MANIKSTANISAIRMAEQGAAPSAPAAGYRLLFVKSDGVYAINSAGVVVGPLAAGMTNPMTTQGDILYGGASGAPTRLAKGAAGQAVVQNAGLTAPEWAHIRTLINEASPTGTSVSWTSIPAGFKSLYIEWIARTDRAGQPTELLYMYFNNDTTATNYYRETMSAIDTTVSAGESDLAYLASVTGATAVAGDPGIGHAEIPGYDQTTFNKAAINYSAERRAAAQQTAAMVTMYWENTAAINRIDIVTGNGSNFVSGSKFRLYGLN